jgi:sec-independent protein translocase protein TatA
MFLASQPTATLAFFGDLLAPQHLIPILIIALLIFGKRLPEVGRGLGKSIIEFKKGLKGVDDDINNTPTGGSNVNVSQERQFEQPQQAYRPPLTDGVDRRVSRADGIEQPMAQPRQASPMHGPTN